MEAFEVWQIEDSQDKPGTKLALKPLTKLILELKYNTAKPNVNYVSKADISTYLLE